MARSKDPINAPPPPARPASHVEVVDDRNLPEVSQTQLEGTSIREFLKNVAAFFNEAAALERQAVATLARAKALPAPTTATADQAIQSFIKDANTDRKVIENHWEITAIVSRFHRRLCQVRDRGTKPLVEASDIANRLHNAYADAERRRAAAEQDRIRREAEENERRRRDEEQAALEAAALKAEESAPTLSEREQAFVDLVVAGVVASQAAYRVGYKDTTRGIKMLELPKIKAAIKAKRDAAAIREQAAARKEEPLDVQVDTVAPNIIKAAGATERTTWAGEILDAAATVEAFRQGKHGIPGDLFTIDPVKLNEYARSLQTALDRWPGVRAKKTTRVV